jgi:hypothetical protein
MSTLVVQPMQWTDTPDISEVAPLSQDDRECLKALRDVLEKYGALDRFGINLIHKHFEIADDECLVETIDIENRTLTTRPMPKQTVGKAIETQWHLANGEPCLVCDQQCVYNNGHASRHYPRP